MKKIYTVTVPVIGYHRYEVVAASQDEALETYQDAYVRRLFAADSEAGYDARVSAVNGVDVDE